MKNVAEHDSFIGRRFGGPAGFRKKLQRLGPIFIKLGQFLALRPDLLPQEYCDELMGLFDRVSPFSPQEAFAILKEDLGREPSELFTHLNPRPIAAGSLAQTHVARTKDGIEVAVKIQRPNIRAMVLRDLGRARLIARVLKLSGASLIVSPDEVVEELTAWMMQEIDFEHELNNLTRLYDLSRSSPFVKVPEPFPHLSGPRVVTCEYLTGIPLSELLSEERDSAIENPPEINLDRLAENLISSSLNQIFRYQFFHADLHPGNLFALPGDLIGFVDFGLCSELDEAVRAGQMRYLSAVYSGDVNRMFKAISEILIPSEETDMEAFRAEFTAETTAALSKIRLGERNTNSTDRDQSTVAQCMVSVMRAARRNRLMVPAGVLALYRTLLTAETVAHRLGTNADLRSVGSRFFSELKFEETLRAIDSENLEPTIYSVLSLLQESPGQIQQILSELSEGRFELKVNIAESTKVRRDRDRRIQFLGASILTVGIALLLLMPNLPLVFGMSLTWPLSILLILLYAWILLQWRRLR